MLTAASCLLKKHDVSLFWDDPVILKRQFERFHIDLSGIRVVPNLFGKTTSLIERLRLTRQYDAILFLTDGSIPIVGARNLILHFQQPIPHPPRSWFHRLKKSRVAAVIVNSNFTKGFIDSGYRVNSFVLYPPVSEDFGTVQIKEPLILSIGRFHPFKKHEVLIKAFTAYGSSFSGYKLVIAGGLLPQDSAYFHSLVKSIKGTGVTLMPNVSQETLKQLLSKAKLYWHAAGYGEREHIHPERFEHFGIAPVEAMASSVVPIVYNGGGLKEIITHGIDGFYWQTVSELVEITKTLIENPKALNKLSNESRKRSDRFSEANFCKELSTILVLVVS